MVRRNNAGAHPTVSIIIVNWNGWEDTVKCLESIFHISYPNYDVILVENGSDDDSVKMIRRFVGDTGAVARESASPRAPIRCVHYSRVTAERGGEAEQEQWLAVVPSNRRLRVILNEKNEGYAIANNVAMRYALKSLRPDYILLLNNDTTVHRDFLGQMVAVAERDEHVGFVGPKISVRVGDDDMIYFPGEYFDLWRGSHEFKQPFQRDEGAFDAARVVDWLTGACLLVKTATIDKIGLLSPDYYLYWEDTDWCFRAKKAGYESVYVPTAKICHAISSSAKRKGSSVLYYMTRGRFYFMKKCASAPQLVTFLAYFFAYEFWIIAGSFIVQGRIAELKTFLAGVYAGLFTDAHKST